MIIIVNEKTILRVFIIVVIPLLSGFFLSPIIHDIWDYVTFDIYKPANESFRPENPLKPIPLEFLFEPKITKLNMTWVNENVYGGEIWYDKKLNNSKKILENITDDQRTFAKDNIFRGLPLYDWMYKENPCEIKIIKWCVKQ